MVRRYKAGATEVKEIPKGVYRGGLTASQRQALETQKQQGQKEKQKVQQRLEEIKKRLDYLERERTRLKEKGLWSKSQTRKYQKETEGLWAEKRFLGEALSKRNVNFSKVMELASQVRQQASLTEAKRQHAFARSFQPKQKTETMPIDRNTVIVDGQGFSVAPEFQEEFAKEELARGAKKVVTGTGYVYTKETKEKAIKKYEVPTEEELQPYLQEEVKKGAGVLEAIKVLAGFQPRTEIYYYNPVTGERRLATEEEKEYYLKQAKQQVKEREQPKSISERIFSYFREQKGIVSATLGEISKLAGFTEKQRQQQEVFFEKIGMPSTERTLVKALKIEKPYYEARIKTVEMVAPATALTLTFLFAPPVAQAGVLGGLATERFSPVTKKEIKEREKLLEQMGFEKQFAKKVSPLPEDIQFSLSVVGMQSILKSSMPPEVKFVGQQQYAESGKVITRLDLQVKRGGLISISEPGTAYGVTKITKMAQVGEKKMLFKAKSLFVGKTTETGFMGREKSITAMMRDKEKAVFIQRGAGKIPITLPMEKEPIYFKSKDIGTVTGKGTFTSGFIITPEKRISLSGGVLDYTPTIRMEIAPSKLPSLFPKGKKGQLALGTFAKETPVTKPLTVLFPEKQVASLSVQAGVKAGVITETPSLSLLGVVGGLSIKTEQMPSKVYLSPQKEFLTQEVISKQRIITSQKTITAQRTITSQRTATAQKLVTAQKLITAQRIPTLPVVPTVVKPITPKVPKTPILPSFKFKPAPTKKPTFQQAYVVQIKRRGKFRTIAQGLPKSLAMQVGVERVSKTLGATFRLIPKGITKIKKAPRISFPKYIKRKKRKPLTFVEVPSARLKSPQEVREIQMARLKI